MVAININNTQIKTASIEIKTLTIEKRQVTLSVFRQIQEESLIDYETLQLLGVPWGSINYFFGLHKDCHSDDWLHIVWQKGNELRREVIAKESIKSKKYLEMKDTHTQTKKHYNHITSTNPYSRYHDCDFSNIPDTIERKKNLEQRYNNVCGWRSSTSKENELNKTLNEIKVVENLIKRSEKRANELEEYFKNEKNNMDNYENKYKLLLKPFFELPQLFIAI